MGKDLKGKECGKGLSQRKDKKYSARYAIRRGKRIEKYFDTLPEARNWLADARYEDMHSSFGPSSAITVDSWFSYWFDKTRPCCKRLPCADGRGTGQVS